MRPPLKPGRQKPGQKQNRTRCKHGRVTLAYDFESCQPAYLSHAARLGHTARASTKAEQERLQLVHVRRVAQCLWVSLWVIWQATTGCCCETLQLRPMVAHWHHVQKLDGGCRVCCQASCSSREPRVGAQGCDIGDNFLRINDFARSSLSCLVVSIGATCEG